MFPIGDENPQLKPPLVTYALIALNVLAWVMLQNMGAYPGLQVSVSQELPWNMPLNTRGRGFNSANLLLFSNTPHFRLLRWLRK